MSQDDEKASVETELTNVSADEKEKPMDVKKDKSENLDLNEQYTEEIVIPKEKSLMCMRTFCAIGLGIVLIYLVYCLIRSSLDTSPEYDSPYIKVFNIYLPIYYLFLQIGFMPPIIIFIKYGFLSAPPYIYPMDKSVVLFFHVVPAFSWIALSVLQVRFLTYANKLGHQVLGMGFITLLYGGFAASAWYSKERRLSPLGKHVMFMESGLLLGILLYFSAAIVFIVVGKWKALNAEADAYWWFNQHKIFMIAAILGTGGPGVFRVLRTIREMITGRIWSPLKYPFYRAIFNRGGEDLEDLQSVESTYFNLAFLLNNVIMFVPYYLEDRDLGNWYVWVILSFPTGYVILGMILAKCGCLNNFKWQLDYKKATVTRERTDNPYILHDKAVYWGKDHQE